MKGNKFKPIAITLGIVGTLLLIVSISLYALGLHSSSQLDNLNVTSSIPVSTPVMPIIVPNTLIKRDLISDRKIKAAPISPKKNIEDIPAKATSFTQNIDNTTQVQDSEIIEIKEENYQPQNVGNIDKLLSGYSSDNFVSGMHPRNWADPRWSESDEQVKKPLDFPSNGKIGEMLPEDFSGRAINIRIPAIKVDSTVEQLAIIEKNGRKECETPKNVVGRIPTDPNMFDSVTGWYFGHLESPIKSEGNVFHNLPEVADYLRDGDPVYVFLYTGDQEFVYQAVKSEVLHESELKLYDAGTHSIVLVTCSNRPYYDHRQLVTAKLVDVRQ
ncbi:MAG: sortase [Candidatus Poribacteria bacterium]|nr:sortase [Candidatus Poribacteria bacterium]